MNASEVAMADGRNDALPDLDYAFLAEYARLEQGGTLTALGASFTQIAVPRLPSAIQLGVAGRVRVLEGVAAVPLTVRMLPAGEGAPEFAAGHRPKHRRCPAPRRKGWGALRGEHHSPGDGRRRVPGRTRCLRPARADAAVHC